MAESKEAVAYKRHLWYLANSDRVRAKVSAYQREHQSGKARYNEDPEGQKARVRSWRGQHKMEIQAYNKQYRDSHKDRRNEIRRKRYAEDESFRLQVKISNRFHRCVKDLGQYGFVEVLGCSLEELRVHLEASFQAGMSWDNYGKWHIDHMRPISSFDLSDPVQVRECFRYTNLQALWAIDNLRKSNKPQGSQQLQPGADESNLLITRSM